MREKDNFLKLPARLVEELGGQEVLSGGRKSRVRGGRRSETRKEARVEKKALRSRPPQNQLKSEHERRAEAEPGGSVAEKPLSKNIPLRNDLGDIPLKPRSILKTTKWSDSVSHETRQCTRQSDKVPRAVKRRLEEEQEIAALEKKLGLNGRKKLPKSFRDDGLDELLDGLDDVQDSAIQEKKRKTEGDEWFDQKRRKAGKTATSKEIDMKDDDELEKVEVEGEISEEGDEDAADDGASDNSLDGPAFPDDVSEESSKHEKELDASNNFCGIHADDIGSTLPAKRVRENPYVAPTVSGNVQKCIASSLRKPGSSHSEALIRLRRQTQGLVNRLTEANLISILGEIEKLYRDNARQDVTSMLVDLLLTSVCGPTILPDPLIILPAGFIAAIYKIIGTDFGAKVVQRTVELFDEHYQRVSATLPDKPTVASSGPSKETSNLIILLSEMYNFQVVGSNLIFDHIRLFLEKLTELNAELLLKIIRTAGPQLRSDDPSSLKDIVSMLRPAVAVVGEENLSSRTKFLIETINDLKNNKMKTRGVASAITSEHTIRMKKILGTLQNRSIRGSEPLRIGLKDIKESDKKGKWWLVGASWSGPSVEQHAEPSSKSTSRGAGKSLTVTESEKSDLVQLAREQRMNTDVRRAIFVAIMSASDYEDAHLRLTKLSLKKKQEYEIPKVLIHCAGAEKGYNPYYTLIAKKLCGDVKLRKSFQFSLWDLFWRMGESGDRDDVQEKDIGDGLDMRHLVNLAKMFGTLIVEGGLGLDVLKKLNLTYLQPKTKSFLEVMMITIFLQSQTNPRTGRDEEAVVRIFTKVRDVPQLIKGLQYFLQKFVVKTDVAGGKEDKATVNWACKAARDALEALVANESVEE